MRQILAVLGARIHQSYCVVALMVGVVFGMAMVVFFRVQIAWSPWMVVAILGLLFVAFIYPKTLFLILAFTAGVLISFLRASGVDLNENVTEMGQIRFIGEFQSEMAAKIRENIGDERAATLGLSYLLGMKGELSVSMSELLRVVGLSHIVVASGTHLSIIVEGCRKIFGRVSRFSGLLFSLVLIFLFGAMIGWTPSIMRAAIVSSLTISMWYVGRKWEPLRLIIITMALTLLVEPRWMANVGWQLSFAAYAGIMLLAPIIKEFLILDKNKKTFLNNIKEVLIASVASIMCLPISLYYFGSFSLLALPANLLILPTMPMVMGATLLSGMMAFWPVVAKAFGWVARVMIEFHILIIEWLGEKKMFLFTIEKYQPGVWLIFVPIFLLILWSYVRRRRQRQEPLRQPHRKRAQY